MLSPTNGYKTPDGFWFVDSGAFDTPQEVASEPYHAETPTYKASANYSKTGGYNWLIRGLFKRQSTSDESITISTNVQNGLSGDITFSAAVIPDDTLTWRTVSDQNELPISGSVTVSGYPQVEAEARPHIARMINNVSSDGMWEGGHNLTGTRIAEQNDEDAGVSDSTEAFTIPPVYDLSTGPVADEFILFAANMPCSAYIMKKLICENANAVGFKTTNDFSFPVLPNAIFRIS